MKPLELARWIITESRQSLSNLELQKVLWFLELKHRVEFKTYLLDGSFEVNDFGVVNTEIYKEYRNFGASSIFIDNPMSFKEKWAFFGRKDKEIGRIGWIDQTIKNLCDIKYLTLTQIMWREKGVVAKKFKSNDRTPLDYFEIHKEAGEVFGIGGIMEIENHNISIL